MQLSFEAANQLVGPAESVAVVGHIRPDADAIGAVCASVLAFEQLGKRAHGLIGQQEDFAPALRTIPGSAAVELSARLPVVDVVIVVDCADLGRTGALHEAIATHPRVIVVDHHDSNTGFGTVDLIDPEAESTTMVLEQWFQTLAIKVERPLAHALYAGLITDTGSFRWGRPEIHDMAARLLATGLDNRAIATELMDAVTPEDLRMIATALGTLRTYPIADGTLAVLAADHELISSARLGATERLLDYVRSLEGCEIGALMKEIWPGSWSVSLRSAHKDVSQIAAALGGGGHLAAAAFVLTGSRETVLAQLLDHLR